MKKTLSFVIPVYNEEKRLRKTFHALQTVKIPAGLMLSEVIFVNDGSTDKTLDLLKTWKRTQKKLRVTIVSYPINQGKGYALKKGMVRAKSSYALFFDADMSTPLTQLKKFAPFIHKNVPIIVGTRKDGKATVLNHQPLYRELLGSMYTKLTRFLLQVPVTDFTCGFKIFSQETAQQLFSQSTINRWGYDAEILFLANLKNIPMQEVTVQWSNDARTKVNLFIDVPRSLGELMQMYWKHIVTPSTRYVYSFLQEALFSLQVKSVTMR